jgi:hypothetical protein
VDVSVISFGPTPRVPVLIEFLSTVHPANVAPLSLT